MGPSVPFKGLHKRDVGPHYELDSIGYIGSLLGFAISYGPLVWPLIWTPVHTTCIIPYIKQGPIEQTPPESKGHITGTIGKLLAVGNELTLSSLGRVGTKSLPKRSLLGFVRDYWGPTRPYLSE